MKPIIEIRTDRTIAYLTPRSDFIKDAYIDSELNGPCTLEFFIPKTSPKCKYLTDAYRFIVDGKEFVILKPDAIEEARDGQKRWVKVQAQESNILLQKKYPTISNDPINPPDTARMEVTILSGGLPLNNHEPGTASHALDALLDGTGWSLGTVDVEGVYDVEEEKINVLEGVEKVQELWGGYLVWDSINKTLSLRDEDKWVNSTGFQIRYAKNLKSITRTIDYDIVTKLYPFGDDDLNIAEVNDGKLYLENHQYTNEVYEGIYQDGDLHTQEQVKEKGIEVLDKLSKPRYNYKISMVDLGTLPEYKHETFSLGDMVRVIDEDLGIDTTVRIIKHKYNIFQPWKCELEVGDEIQKLESMIAQARKAAEYVKILKPNTSIGNMLKGVINTFATTINSANGKLVWDDSMLQAIEIDEHGEETGMRIRINPGGVGISKDGGQTYVTAMTGMGILANTIICTELYALSSQDGFTKMVDNGVKVFDDAERLRAHLGNHGQGGYGLLLRDATGQITILDDEGMMQTWQEGRADNITNGYPLTLNIYLPSETRSVHKAILRFKRLAFRAYSTGAASGGGETVSISSNTTGASSTTTTGPSSSSTTGVSDHNHTIGNINISIVHGSNQRTTGSAEGHSHSYDDKAVDYILMDPPTTTGRDGAHSHSMNHTHSLSHTHGMSHQHSIRSHTHDINYGIYTGSSPGTVSVKVNGSSIGSYASDQTNINIASHLTAGQWNAVELSASTLGRIDATVFIQAKMGV